MKQGGSLGVDTSARLQRGFARARMALQEPVQSHLHRPLQSLQHERLIKSLPLLCLVIAANSLAMAVAVLGDLPWWQQVAPPAILIAACLTILIQVRRKPVPHDSEAAAHQLKCAPLIAAPLGLVAGLWCVNAFIETERFYCMTAPLFIGIAAVVCATCLLSVPRAAIAAMLATVTPIVIKMLAYENLGVRAMALMLVLLTAMQAWVVRDKFRETIRTLELQSDLNRLARTDPLTGLDNRLAFGGLLQDHLARGGQVRVVLADLDGFKAINDRHGHHAGDQLLVELAARMRVSAPDALSISRLGGDEFAMLFDIAGGDLQAWQQTQAVIGAIGMPYRHGVEELSIGTSTGTADGPNDGTAAHDLMLIADARLYRDKAARRSATPEFRLAATG